MQNIKSITFVLENCDSISFPGNVIGDFRMGDFSKHICCTPVKAFERYNVARHVFIELYADGDTNYPEFGFEDKQRSKFDRLFEHLDITQIEIEYEGGTKEKYYVSYDEGKAEGILGAENINEKVLLSNAGNLYILIDADLEMEDVLDMDKLH